MDKLVEYSIDEISKHNTKESLWIIIDDHVFDMVKYQYIHPGGYRILQKNAGKDVTKLFYEINHVDANIEPYCIGIVKKN
jgi:cytochrome b involved in lipid metabolism